jgi:uncharacterized membrane protein YqjE
MFVNKILLKVLALEIIWPMFNFLYKLCLLFSFFAIMTTLSFYINLLDVKKFHFDAVIKTDILLILIIILRNYAVWKFKLNRKSGIED